MSLIVSFFDNGPDQIAIFCGTSEVTASQLWICGFRGPDLAGGVWGLASSKLGLNKYEKTIAVGYLQHDSLLECR